MARSTRAPPWLPCDTTAAAKLLRRDSWAKSKTGLSNHDPKNTSYDDDTIHARDKNRRERSSAPDFAAQWPEARLVYPLYAALATQFDLAPLPYPAGELPPQRPTRDVFDRDLKWLDDDRRESTRLPDPPASLRDSECERRGSARLIHRQLKKPDKTTPTATRSICCWCSISRCARPRSSTAKRIALDDVAQVLQPVLAEADATPLEWCEPLEKILEKLEALPQPARHDGRRPARAGPPAEGFGRRACFTIRRRWWRSAGSISLLAARFHSHAACGFERRARSGRCARSQAA